MDHVVDGKVQMTVSCGWQLPSNARYFDWISLGTSSNHSSPSEWPLDNTDGQGKE